MICIFETTEDTEGTECSDEGGVCDIYFILNIFPGRRGSGDTALPPTFTQIVQNKRTCAGWVVGVWEKRAAGGGVDEVY